MQDILITKEVGIVRGLRVALPDVIRGIAKWALSFSCRGKKNQPMGAHFLIVEMGGFSSVCVVFSMAWLEESTNRCPALMFL